MHPGGDRWSWESRIFGTAYDEAPASERPKYGFAQTQPEWPPTAPADLDLDTTAGLIKGMSPISPLLGIEQERRFHSQMAWIGVVDEVTSGWLWLHEVRPDARWTKRPLGYKLRRITKVFISSRYLTALVSIAGTGPAH